MSLADRIGASQDTVENIESVLRYFCMSEIVRLKEGYRREGGVGLGQKWGWGGERTRDR